MKNQTKKVRLNIIQAEVYARNPQILAGVQGKRSGDVYYELRERVQGNATYNELVPVPYPVTAESVNSFETSTDYKRDVESAMNMPARGVNLGDIVDMQRVMSMDKAEAQKLVGELNAKILAGKTAQNVDNSTQENKSEVKDK